MINIMTYIRNELIKSLFDKSKSIRENYKFVLLKFLPD